MEREWFTREELADWLRIPRRTLEDLDYRGRGPRRHKIGRSVRYRRRDVMSWLETRAVDQASPAGAAAGAIRSRPA